MELSDQERLAMSTDEVVAWAVAAARRRSSRRRVPVVDPVKTAARYAVAVALRDGRLVRPTVCSNATNECAGRIEAHHPDYSKPLDVRWLCVRCHHALHPPPPLLRSGA